MNTALFPALSPEAVLLATAALALIAGLIWSGRNGRLPLMIGIAGGLAAMILGLYLRDGVAGNAPGAMFQAGALLTCFRTLFCSALVLCLLFSFRTHEVSGWRRPEFTAILAIHTAGLSIVASAQNLALLYLSIELAGITAYALTAFNHAHRRSVEGGLKYAVYGAVASGLMLFGMSLLFGLSGGLDYQSLGRSLASASGPASMLQSLAVLLFLGGLFFKIAAFPFHAWCPDAYEGAPTPFTAFVSVAPKAAGFAALARFAFTVLSAGGAAETSPPSGGVPWLAVLGAVSVATMTFGNLAAITQQSIKRMLAYSSIAHAGYMLMGVVALSQEGLSALIAYIVIYLIMNMGAFLAVIAGSEVSGGETFDDWQGMGKRAPLLAASMTVFMLSLTGIPPLAGFVGKFYLFAAVVSRGGAWYWVLAVAGVLNSVVSLYYYARVLKSMYLADRETGGRQDGPVPLGQNLLLCILAAVTLLLGLYWTPLAEFARMSAVF